MGKCVDIIESFTWVPFDLSQIDKLRVKSTEVVTSEKRYRANVYGIQPSLFVTWNTRLLRADNEKDMDSKLFTRRNAKLQVGMGQTEVDWAFL